MNTQNGILTTSLSSSAPTTVSARFLSSSSKTPRETTQVPDYTPYTKGTSQTSSRAYSYFMVGSMGLITAAGAKSLVSDFLANMSASSDVLALAKVEVDLSEISEGKVSFSYLILRHQLSIVATERHYQVARKARLHPTSYRRRDQRGERMRRQELARPPDRRRSSQEARVVRRHTAITVLSLTLRFAGSSCLEFALTSDVYQSVRSFVPRSLARY